MKYSIIKDCFLNGRVGENTPLFSGGGSVCVRLKGYAVIPIEAYEGLMAAATRLAEMEAAEMIMKVQKRSSSDG